MRWAAAIEIRIPCIHYATNDNLHMYIWDGIGWFSDVHLTMQLGVLGKAWCYPAVQTVHASASAQWGILDSYQDWIKDD